MEKQVKTPKMIRQRKFMLMLPLLALPFMTMMFWALGGGKVQKAEAQAQKQEGFNLQLPSANFKDDKPMDKMSYYDRAQLDSAKFLELVKNDPNYRNTTFSNTENNLQEPALEAARLDRGLNTSVYGSSGYNDPNSEKIYQKLDALNKELNRPVSASTAADNMGTGNPVSNKGVSVGTADVDRLEQMMQMMNQPDETDPEMQQINGMLEKILDIQHPDRIQEKLRQTSETRRGQVFAVSSQFADNTVSLLNGKQSNSQVNGFYSLGDAAFEESQNAIQAVIHETQTIVDGSTVKLRLVNNVFINGVHIPKDNFVFGTASLRGERLAIQINSIRYNNSLFPVELSVYDMDGLDGIYIPGAITRDVAKQSADRSLQTLGLTSLDPSWQAQAAGAGVEAAKSLISKKVKLIKVTVKAGYQVLLRDEKQKQDQSS
jgi:conjugative transposon TraM protein